MAADGGDALSHAEQAEAIAARSLGGRFDRAAWIGLGGGQAGAVVGDFDDADAGGLGDADVHPGGAGVADGVAEAFLDDAEGDRGAAVVEGCGVDLDGEGDVRAVGGPAVHEGLDGAGEAEIQQEVRHQAGQHVAEVALHVSDGGEDGGGAGVDGFAWVGRGFALAADGGRFALAACGGGFALAADGGGFALAADGGGFALAACGGGAGDAEGGGVAADQRGVGADGEQERCATSSCRSRASSARSSSCTRWTRVCSRRLRISMSAKRAAMALKPACSWASSLVRDGARRMA